MIHTAGHCLLKLLCPDFANHRNELFQILNPIMFSNNMRFRDDKKLVHLLLYGHKKLELHDNESILKATLNFIKNSLRFSQI